MAIIILIHGRQQMAGGVLVALGAKSAIHEIRGAVALGSGGVSFALSAIIAKIDDAAKAMKKFG